MQDLIFSNLILNSLSESGPDKDLTQAIFIQAKRERPDFFRHGEPPVYDEEPFIAQQAKAAIEISIFKPELNAQFIGKSL